MFSEGFLNKYDLSNFSLTDRIFGYHFLWVIFQEYLNHRLSNEFQVESPYEQLEYVLTASDDPSYRARTASIRLKASTRFFEAIKKYGQSLELSGMLFKDIIFSGGRIQRDKKKEVHAITE